MGESLTIVEVAMIVISSICGLPVRMSPTQNAPAIGRVYSGEFAIVDSVPVETDGLQETWVQIVVYDDKTGWLHWDYLSNEMRQEFRIYAREANHISSNSSDCLRSRNDRDRLAYQSIGGLTR